MISFLMEICSKFDLLLNFLSHFILFLILGYVVFRKETLNKLHSTIVWYTALASFFISVTIFIEWIFGKGNPLSYNNMRLLSDSIFFINLLMLFGIMYKNRKILEKKLE